MPTRHDALSKEYAAAMRAAQTQARDWWSALVKKDGEKAVRSRWPAGPASHPRVIGVLRKYWFACSEINREIEAGRGKKGEDAVYPHLFLGEDLLDGKNDDLGYLLNDLKYWPIGLDADDRYV